MQPRGDEIITAESPRCDDSTERTRKRQTKENEIAVYKKQKFLNI